MVMLGQRKGKRIASVVGAGAAVVISGALLLKTFPHLGNGLYNFLVGKGKTDHLSDDEEDNDVDKRKTQPTTTSLSYSNDRVLKRNYAEVLKASEDGRKSILNWARQVCYFKTIIIHEI
ncbi:Piso0_003259 [Millerozyma farinosa CBS 7064]|uniref:Piso0_003259 protein n=1 Tax=Pichia sorbitophila (strain ATCC MYA-4447 / BCRC 22081 / CBS 7064 / NBRC 10061 / NRRL Y-12695) TaxID=559304 RepID=G8YHM0_PICSO|nr:Piso0_003259 [Millerozyma farinosa CBS 7064]CCE80922.1 Piso0_003259 [Millerozyma farinosa CBS 7064]